MAMSSGANAPASLAATTAVDVFSYDSVHQEDMRVICRVASDTAFRLNLIATASPTVPTNYVVKQVASSTITVDGATAGYTQIAEIDTPMPAAGKMQIYNPGGGAINWVADFRIYRGGN